jgi:hypothetical protein
MKILSERLKVAQAELKIAQRAMNQAERRVHRLLGIIAALAKRIELRSGK